VGGFPKGNHLASKRRKAVLGRKHFGLLKTSLSVNKTIQLEGKLHISSIPEKRENEL
jgi:hypothetical protein